MELENHIKELIVRFLQSEIREDEIRELDAWIYKSEENKSHFFEMKRIFDSRKQPAFSEDQTITDSWERMLAKLRKHSLIPGEPARHGHVFWLSCAHYAAIVAVAIGIGFGIGGLTGQRTLGGEIEYNEIFVEKGGGTNTVLLSDGSKIRLNASTRFKYPTQFNGDKREVYLEGEAFFEVVRNESKPFVVKLKNQSITVLGTTFNVQAYAEEQYSITTLLSGSIFLESFNSQGKGMSSMTLKPNQQAHSDNRTGSIFLSETEASISNAWVEGKYRFKDEVLSSIVRRLENYYGVNIRLAHDTLRNIRYTGTFSLDQNIQEVLEVINSEDQFSFTMDGKNILISARP